MNRIVIRFGDSRKPLFSNNPVENIVFFRAEVTDIIDHAVFAFEVSNSPFIDSFTAEEKNVRLIWGDNRSLSVNDIVEVWGMKDVRLGSFKCLNTGWKRF